MRALFGVLIKIEKFRTYSFQDKLLILKAFFITGIMRIIIILIPFKLLKKYMGEYNEESSFYSYRENNNRIEKICWAVTKISKYTPWKSKCLVQALTAEKLLYDEGFESTLYLGVNKNLKTGVIEAHAWLRCGEVYVTGGNGNEFFIVAKFKK